MRHIEYIGARPIFLDQCGTEMMGSVPQFPWKLKGTFLKIAGEEGGGKTGHQGKWTKDVQSKKLITTSTTKKAKAGVTKKTTLSTTKLYGPFFVINVNKFNNDIYYSNMALGLMLKLLIIESPACIYVYIYCIFILIHSV